jgi:hypothetical protein
MDVYPERVAAPTSALAELGFDVRQTADAPLDPAPEEIAILWGNAVWFPRALRSLEEMPERRRPTTVIWHVEPLPPPRDSGLRWPRPRPREIAKIVLRDRRASDVYSNVRTLERLARRGLPDVLAVISAERVRFLAERGIDAALVPYGYEPLDGHDLGLERDLDVLHLTAANLPDRRRAVRRLKRAGIAVKTAGSYSDPSLWGESRTQLVNRVKIMLSISRFPGTFTSKRFMIGMACNSLVVSDPLYDPAPFVRDVHFVEAPVEELPDLIEHYLANDGERRRIAQQGHDFVTGELTMRKSITQLLQITGERSRPPVAIRSQAFPRV